LLTGYRPFDGGTDYEVMQKIMTQPLEAASTFNLHLSSNIDAVLAKALDKSPARRYANAQEFNQAFQTAVQAASDLTITPAPRKRNAQDGTTFAATVSQPSRPTAATDAGSASLPSSTVTQEVELVYWKEIKESADPVEFQAFLAKFPEGIYAELARKRLARLGKTGAPAATAPARKRSAWLPLALGAVVLVAAGIGIGYEKFSAPQIAATVAAPLAPASPATATAVTAPATRPAHTPAKAVAAANKAPAPLANSNAAPLDPNRECEGRVLLGYLTCIQEQCTKPRYAEHPVCVERRNEEQRNRANSP
jgi:serine/threonine-protein kinase